LVADFSGQVFSRRTCVGEPSDRQLISDALQGAAGGAAAFDVLVLRYQDRLVHSLEHSLGSREDALDAAQQAFLLAWRQLSKFRGESGFYSWLYRIARNAAISNARRRRPVGSLDQLTEAGLAEPADQGVKVTPGAAMEVDEEVQRLRQALAQVPQDFREVLVLKDIDDMSYEQIAELLGIPAGTVRSRLFRARQNLLERMQRLERDH
jgi:RNA polymerase sigma-70 factor (ECF subfamily)